MKEKTILFVGGDQRQKELFDILKAKKFNVASYGLFENEPQTNKCDFLVLPFPSTKNENINAPFCKEKITFSDIMPLINKNTIIIGGKIPKNKFLNNFIFDYADDENLTYYNAFLTAEAAISISINNSKKSLCGSNVLITGMGRISKHLSLLLKAFNSNITICARKEKDRAFAKSLGFSAINFEVLVNEIYNFDFVFNTVPTQVFNREILKNANKNTLFIDLASTPGGFEKNDNLNIITALALPGKYSPITAAETIYKTIRPFLNKEEKTWMI